MGNIVVIDDDEAVLSMIAAALECEEHKIICFSLPSKAIDEIPRIDPDLIITDIKMNGLSGFDVLSFAKEFNPEINVILITAFASVDTAVSALRCGAFDYLIKPFKIKDLRVIVKRAMSEKKLILKKGAYFANNTKVTIGRDPLILEVLDIVSRVAKTDSTVLIRGESGTGKELVARSLHSESLRARKPFVSVNCAALPDALLESELFGYEKGAFTGAVDFKMGLIEFANGGTLFLDEVGDIAPQLQVKLLRVLQERMIKRLGGVEEFPVDVRVVSATSRHLESDILENRFREDLFYRLNVIPVVLPPLRERKSDIPFLVEHFIDIYNMKAEMNYTYMPDVMNLFLSHNWPGNIRELENTIERLLALSSSNIIDFDFVRKYWAKDLEQNVRKDKHEPFVVALKNETEQVERDSIIQALKRTDGNKLQAAKRLNISRQSLQYKLRKYGI